MATIRAARLPAGGSQRCEYKLSSCREKFFVTDVLDVMADDTGIVDASLSVPAQLTGGTGNDNLQGGAGDDTLLGGAGDDALTGDAGADVQQAGAGHDKLDGGAGVDLLLGGEGDDSLKAGDLADAAELEAATGDILSGGAGDDDLKGKKGAEDLFFAEFALDDWKTDSEDRRLFL